MSSSRTMGRKSVLSLGTIAKVLLVFAACLLAERVPRSLYADFRANPADLFGDFNYYFYAFTTVLQHPGDLSRLYDHEALVAFLQSMGARNTGEDVFFGYPPQFALLFSPLAHLSPLAAKGVWAFGSIVLFGTGVAMLAKLAYRGENRAVPLLIVAIALLSRPLLDDFYLGQSNELLFFLIVATFFFIDRGNHFLAGLFLGTAIVLKVTPLAIAGLLLLRREWRTAIATAVTSLAITAFTAWQLGFQVMLHYLVSDMPRLNAQNLLLGGAPANNSLRGAFQALSKFAGMSPSQSVLGAIWLVTAIVVCTIAVVLVYRQHADRRIDFALACTTMLVASPMLEPVHLVALLIPVAILFGTTLERAETRLSAIGPRVELVLASCAVLILFFSARNVGYFVAVSIVYVLCLGRYFAPVAAGQRGRWQGVSAGGRS
ncbi:Polyprenol-phosphate-mannose-dependent alpha-(1-2)-phosphatidylinositol mannoside mannosyltransferase [Caballeronia arvi]|uniref:Polyprenol-phosphate-mannose-dependent alpha-(1-2)-phosphatidylinositol mannoside mannosyltransferase n=2 Tax=Caballeronia arvi TaxID=1777135 RepID=A0A158JDD9_9BURK|nr:Polyprenol-phosphate-mannose-dependent alpha-(1-2)-phosphatidylinositol mannoside mannosyltransferase [Caballeronia arvi]